jgi:hypothetical protein
MVMPIIAFEEWVSRPYFYDELTDGNEVAVGIFQRYKELIDAEAMTS